MVGTEAVISLKPARQKRHKPNDKFPRKRL